MATIGINAPFRFRDRRGQATSRRLFAPFELSVPVPTSGHRHFSAIPHPECAHLNVRIYRKSSSRNSRRASAPDPTRSCSHIRLALHLGRRGRRIVRLPDEGETASVRPYWVSLPERVRNEAEAAMTAASDSLRMPFLPLWAVRAAGPEWNLLLGSRRRPPRACGLEANTGVYAPRSRELLR